MLTALRNGAKSTPMRIFLIALALSFALWGINDVFRSVSNNDTAVKAGQIEITTTEAAIEFDRTRRAYLPGVNNSEAIAHGLLNEVLGGLARRALFSAEANRLNLSVTREMEKHHLENEPAFQDETGRFSALRFSSALARAGFDEETYLNYLRQDLLRAQIFEAINSGMRYPASLAEILAKWRLERRVIDYVEIPVDPATESEPSDAELNAWYNENKDSFNSPDLRRVTALVLSPEGLHDTVTISDDEAQQFYNDNIDLYQIVERRNLRQMIFTSAEEAEAAIQRMRQGDAFADVAQEMLSLSREDTSLGLLSREDLTEELTEPIFNASLGEVIGPVSTDLGHHVLIVDTIADGSTSSFAEVKDRVVNILKYDAATDLVYSRIPEVEDSLATGATLEEVALATGVSLVTIEGMDRNGLDIDGNLIDGIAGDTRFRETVWTSPLGEVSLTEETDAETFYILRVDDENPSAERSLHDVRVRAITQLKTERAIQKARRDAEGLAEADDLARAATALGFKAVTSPSFRRDGVSFDHVAARLIANTAFATDMGEAAIIETGEATIALTVTEITPAPEATLDSEIDVMVLSLSNNMRSDLEGVMTNGLTRIHDVEINPALVQNLLIGSNQ